MCATALATRWLCNWPLMTTWPRERPRVCDRPGDPGAFLSRSLPGSPRLGTCTIITQPSPHQHVDINQPVLTFISLIFFFFFNNSPSKHKHLSSVSNFYYGGETLEFGLSFLKGKMWYFSEIMFMRHNRQHRDRELKIIYKMNNNARFSSVGNTENQLTSAGKQHVASRTPTSRLP